MECQIHKINEYSCFLPKRKYQQITQELRWKFLNKIFSKKCTIKQAAKECGIVFSTAKVILKTYKKEGRVGKKLHRSKKIKTIDDGIFNETVIEIQKNPTFPAKLANQKSNCFLNLKKKICHFKQIEKQPESNCFIKSRINESLLKEKKNKFLQNAFLTGSSSNFSELAETTTSSSQNTSPKRSFIPYVKQASVLNLMPCARVLNPLVIRINQNY